MKRTISLILIGLMLIVNQGCNKRKNLSFDKANLPQSIIELCKTEYNLEGISVSIKGKTLYIKLKVDNILIDSIKLSESTRDKLDNLFLVSSRACLSTNADINFCRIVAYDDKTPGIQLMLSRYALDIKRFFLGDISRGETSKRLAINIEFNPTIFGTSAVRGFFKDMQNQNAAFIIKNYFPGKINLLNISPSIYSQLIELGLKENRKHEILELKNKRISDKKTLIYCKVKETFTPKKDRPLEKYSSPNDFTNEYLFLINAKKFPKVIEKILSLYALDKDNKLKYIGFPEEYKKHENLETWEIDESGEVDLKLQDFLSDQIASRISGDFKSDKKLNLLYSVNNTAVKFNDKTKTFDITVDISKNNTPEALELYDNFYYEILKTIVDMITTIIRRYDFQDFEKIKINYTTKNKSIILTKQVIQQYRKKKIEIKDMLQSSTNKVPTAFAVTK